MHCISNQFYRLLSRNVFCLCSLSGGRGAADGLTETAPALHQLHHLLHRPSLPSTAGLSLPVARLPVNAAGLSACQGSILHHLSNNFTKCGSEAFIKRYLITFHASIYYSLMFPDSFVDVDVDVDRSTGFGSSWTGLNATLTTPTCSVLPASSIISW